MPEEDVLVQVQHALKLVGMAEYQNRPTHTLSGGQKQRVAIAGALAECPKVTVLELYLFGVGVCVSMLVKTLNCVPNLS